MKLCGAALFFFGYLATFAGPRSPVTFFGGIAVVFGILLYLEGIKDEIIAGVYRKLISGGGHHEE